MLTKTEKKFTVLFMFLLLAELISVSNESLSSWHYFTKPSLLIALIVYFYLQSKTIAIKSRVLILLALLFSLSGDVLLMFVSESPNYFMLGLIAFLLAHVFYCVVFLRERNPKIKPIGLIIILVFYAFGLFYLLQEGLGDLLPAVVFYMIVILLMVVTAFLRKKKVINKSYIFVFLGAILFVISDSILALNKFYMPLRFSGITIMLTYALAQFFIVIGLLKQR